MEFLAFTDAGLAFVPNIPTTTSAGEEITVLWPFAPFAEKTVKLDIISTRDGVRTGFLSRRASAPLYRTYKKKAAWAAEMEAFHATHGYYPDEYRASTQFEEAVAESRYALDCGYD